MADDPISRIQDMKKQGMQNNQIVEKLQHEGMSSGQIFDALSKVEGVGGSAPMQSPPSRPPMQQAPPSGPPRMPMMQQTFQPDNEELIEAIIDEKWNDLMSDINKVIAWKESTESRITKMEQQFKDLKDQFGDLHKAVVGKVGEYDQHILDVGAEVKAMEKVFSKVLPVFTDNVAELARVADSMKASQKKK